MGFWVSNKCKALASLGNIFNINSSLLREETKNRENYTPKYDGGYEVQGGENSSINVDFVLESVKNFMLPICLFNEDYITCYKIQT